MTEAADLLHTVQLTGFIFEFAHEEHHFIPAQVGLFGEFHLVFGAFGFSLGSRRHLCITFESDCENSPETQFPTTSVQTP